MHAKAVEYASTFEVWKEERFVFDEETGKMKRILGEWLNYDVVAGEPRKASTSAFWETHLLYGAEFAITVAHEAAHGLGYSDVNKAAENYARSCMK